MKHADMSPSTKARVDAGARLGRKLQELENAVRLNAIDHAAKAYVECKRDEHRHALDDLIREAQLEGRAAAETDRSAKLAIDYERDWAGEVRNDPDDNNGYVLRKVWASSGDYWVRVNDVLGGHDRVLELDAWLKWPK